MVKGLNIKQFAEAVAHQDFEKLAHATPGSEIDKMMDVFSLRKEGIAWLKRRDENGAKQSAE